MTSKEFVEKWAALLDATLDPYCVEHEVEMLADLNAILSAHREAVLEDAAKVAEACAKSLQGSGAPDNSTQMRDEYEQAYACEQVAAAIRALSVKP